MFSFKPSYPHPTVDHNRAQGEILKAILVLPFPHFSPLPPDLIFLFFSFSHIEDRTQDLAHARQVQRH